MVSAFLAAVENLCVEIEIWKIQLMTIINIQFLFIHGYICAYYIQYLINLLCVLMFLQADKNGGLHFVENVRPVSN